MAFVGSMAARNGRDNETNVMVVCGTTTETPSLKAGNDSAAFGTPNVILGMACTRKPGG